MPKGERRPCGTIIGAVGGTLIGAAILLFVVTMIFNNLKDANADQADSDTLNDTIDTISNILTVCGVLFYNSMGWRCV